MNQTFFETWGFPRWSYITSTAGFATSRPRLCWRVYLSSEAWRQ